MRYIVGARIAGMSGASASLAERLNASLAVGHELVCVLPDGTPVFKTDRPEPDAAVERMLDLADVCDKEGTCFSRGRACGIREAVHACRAKPSTSEPTDEAASRALAILSRDSHKFVATPCSTCAEIGKILGRDFGCTLERWPGA